MKNFIITIIPIIVTFFLVIFGLYFSYYIYFIKINIEKTKNDIVEISSNIYNFYKGTYKNLNTSNIVEYNLFPYDLKKNKISNFYSVENRFGGNVFIYESFAYKKEKLLYLNMYPNIDEYTNTYKGVKAFIIYLNNLNKKECVNLATIDWKKLNPRFIGLEASYATTKSPNNGIYNLQYHLLLDNSNDRFYKTNDIGEIYRSSIPEEKANKLCKCFWNNCTFALKFI